MQCRGYRRRFWFRRRVERVVVGMRGRIAAGRMGEEEPKTHTKRRRVGHPGAEVTESWEKWWGEKGRGNPKSPPSQIGGWGTRRLVVADWLVVMVMKGITPEGVSYRIGREWGCKEYDCG